MNPCCTARPFWITFFIFCNIGFSFSQLVNVDSLKLLLQPSPPLNVESVERLHGLAAHYWRIKPDSSIYFAEQALSLAETLKNDRLVGISKYLKATVLSDKQENVLARQLYEEAITIFRNGRIQPNLMQAIANYGVTFINENNYDEAEKWLNQSLEMARVQQNTKGQAFGLGNLGLIADMRGDKKQAIALYTQAIKYYEQSGDWGRVAVVNHNIGALYSNMEDQKSAIEHTLLACAGYRRVKNFKSLNTGLLNLIFYYKETDSLEQANRYVSEVEQSTYPLNPAQKALFWILKGHIAEKKKNFPLAIELLDSCIAQAKLANSPINLHNGQATLARIQLTQKQYAPALKNALSALDIALEMNDATSINLDQKFVAKAYEGLGNTAEAVRFYSAYEQGRDTLYTQETFQAVRNIEEKYETEKKERMIQAQRAEIAEQRFGLGAAIFMVLSLMVAVIWLYTSRKIRQQKLVAEQMANQLLQEQKDQLQMANTELQESLAKAAEHAILTQEVSDMVINLSNRDKTQLRLGDILYIESKGNFVHLHTANERLIDWQMINHYETLLAPSNLFMRTHRSFLVNRLHVSGRRATEITISNGHKVTIASTPSTKAAVHSWLDQWVQEG